MSKERNSLESIDIAYVASLARLKVEESEREKLQEDMSQIVKYIDMLSSLNVDGVEPTMHACGIKNSWREDIQESKNIKEYAMANAPATIDNELIKVPQVIPGEEEA